MATALLGKMFNYFDEVSTYIQVQELIFSVFDDKRPKWADIDEEQVLQLLDEVSSLQRDTFEQLASDNLSPLKDVFHTELERGVKLKAENEALMNELRELEASRDADTAANPDNGDTSKSRLTNRDDLSIRDRNEAEKHQAETENVELHDEGLSNSFANIDALRENETRLRAVVARRERHVAALRSRIEVETARERDLSRTIAALRTPANADRRRIAEVCRNLLRMYASFTGVRDVSPTPTALSEQTLQLAFANDVRVTFAFETAFSTGVQAGSFLAAKQFEAWLDHQRAVDWLVRIVSVEPEIADRHSRVALVLSDRQFAPLFTWINRINQALRADLS